MKRLFITILSLILAITFILTNFVSVAAQIDNTRIIGYFVEWGVYARDYHVYDIPADKLTHLNYGFAQVKDGEVAIWDQYAAVQKHYELSDTWDESQEVKGSFNQLRILKEKNPHLKTLISVGGWSGSKDFSAIASNDAARKKFAQSALTFIEKYGFDGVDIDWEFPVIGGQQPGSPQDKENFTLLMKELRSSLGSKYLLTATVSANPAGIDAIEYHKVMQYLDWVNVMTYDLHGYWDARTGHHTALFNNNDPVDPRFNINAAVEHLRVLGVPTDKIVPGVAFYGRSFSGVNNQDNGLHQPFKGKGPGTFEQGILDYKDIKDHYLNKNGYIYQWDDEAQAPFLFNADKNKFISFDDARSVEAKANFVKDQGLGGLMFWELSNDNGELLNVISDTFSGSFLPIKDTSHSTTPVNAPVVEVNPIVNVEVVDQPVLSNLGDIESKHRITSDWVTGYCAEVDIINKTDKSLDWIASFEVEGSITSLWNANYFLTRNTITIDGENWNNILDPHEATVVGYCADREVAPEVAPIDEKAPDSVTDVETVDPVILNNELLSYRVRRTAEWQMGFCSDITIKNDSDHDIDWVISLEQRGEVTSLWNGEYTLENDALTIEGVDWNNIIKVGEETVVGFCGKFE